MPDKPKQFRCAPDVLFQEVNGELVLLDLEAEKYFGLNRTGARVWQLLGDGRSPEQIIDTVQSEFLGDPAAIAADVQQLLGQLHDAGLLIEA